MACVCLAGVRLTVSGHASGKKEGRAVVLIAAGTRDEKMAFAGAARKKKMKRIVQGLRRPDANVRSALDAWKAEGGEEEKIRTLPQRAFTESRRFAKG